MSVRNRLHRKQASERARKKTLQVLFIQGREPRCTAAGISNLLDNSERKGNLRPLKIMHPTKEMNVLNKMTLKTLLARFKEVQVQRNR